MSKRIVKPLFALSTVTASITATNMKSLAVRQAKITYPTGNKSFAVLQAFPAGFTAEEADPFLMCDEFGPSKSTGVITDPDQFPVGWHPHRGMDIMTYLVQGYGRHADSLGHRGGYATPGMQWISVGSGIEHAEGGGTPEGMIDHGFQIWVNVPAKHKMDDPEYGTEPPENLPTLEVSPGVNARLLAGPLQEHVGPFKTKQDVQMVDIEFQSSAKYMHSVPNHMNNCMIYVYRGSATIAGQAVPSKHIIRLDATDPNKRDITIENNSKAGDLGIMIFAGAKLNEPIAWHGPFVMNTDEEIDQAISEYRSGTFLKRKASWNYKRIADRPKESNPEL